MDRHVEAKVLILPERTDPAQDQARMAAARRYGAAVEPFASGVYVNDLTDEGQAGIHRAYRPDTLAGLVALKDRYDPGNLFHHNHNIPPTIRGQADRSLGEQPPRSRHHPQGGT